MADLLPTIEGKTFPTEFHPFDEAFLSAFTDPNPRTLGAFLKVLDENDVKNRKAIEGYSLDVTHVAKACYLVREFPECIRHLKASKKMMEENEDNIVQSMHRGFSFEKIQDKLAESHQHVLGALQESLVTLCVFSAVFVDVSKGSSSKEAAEELKYAKIRDIERHSGDPLLPQRLFGISKAVQNYVSGDKDIEHAIKGMSEIEGEDDLFLEWAQIGVSLRENDGPAIKEFLIEKCTDFILSAERIVEISHQVFGAHAMVAAGMRKMNAKFLPFGLSLCGFQECCVVGFKHTLCGRLLSLIRSDSVDYATRCALFNTIIEFERYQFDEGDNLLFSHTHQKYFLMSLLIGLGKLREGNKEKAMTFLELVSKMKNVASILENTIEAERTTLFGLSGHNVLLDFIDDAETRSLKLEEAKGIDDKEKVEKATKIFDPIFPFFGIPAWYDSNFQEKVVIVLGQMGRTYGHVFLKFGVKNLPKDIFEAKLPSLIGAKSKKKKPIRASVCTW